MNSSLCLGWVSHRRLTPRRHAFRYRIGMFYLDLDEQTWLLKLSLWLGRWRLAPLCWRETDYLPALTRQGEPLAQAARLLVHQATGHMPEGPVRLLTQLRCWGLSFNPVSFYFCHDRDGRLAAILLEVRNTPWRERFHYVLPVQGNLAKRFTVAKAFHVSPFMPLDMDYHLRFSLDAAHVRIHMQNWQGGRKVFEADLTLQRQPLDAPALRRYVLTFPWMSLHTVLAIYWQALRLLFKRTPVHDHTTRQGDLALGQPCEDPEHVESHPER
ncbi:DUF1365 domain-containing protein [Pseudomonas sp. P1B16]|uniref:DUF1365 domain-containing protein n=1 Tax=Pseudomonas capeferrum TaxID=1495066 RepID=A0ABY7R3F2_9PSED|nr:MULTISPECIES: DUF1365 domain-containing protein [Pseudomonas]MUT49596.1 DUF1365 family protein [Pseudomonas sp. TDA1]KGI92804.1 hypothetical protein MD26_13810 [Pseudomonas sp. H2]MDD2064073.1 DUF1365 domain-containing protein [Pseudomonas sp. 25571]MDD2130661.1 DUF1365 domain-containing protein [Pseudomonas sp. 17391]UDU79162.1 DUF1365 domain-containing protein [Pseudomonas sp. HN2-3]